ncbi:hypothetical protein [Lacticaseibacillus nasuensis]|uniref:Mga helix-turn-helix domain-containing protein n=1 Tax=Lacticaseibacillus nasuensis JCM 17158 TaxID=1291734 RepID=A0A0R1JWC7_9LACO|nr:hypothetical protein [Lacticaseibacillus nasuensis]KRK72657.1 hypothetical protein FD02_GL001630 [Lacticaseibacillus nasuensis JCM 17158]
MNFTALFNQSDQTTYAILQALMQRTDLTRTTTSLAADYDLTPYQLNKYFETINADLQTVTTGTPAYLDASQRGVWRAHGLTTYMVQRIGLLALQRSNLFIVFEYEFFYKNRLAKRDYINQHAISTPNFYLMTNSLHTLLANEHFYAATGGATNPESIIRLHLFELYYTAYTGVATPFAELNASVEPLLQCCADFIGHPLRPTQVTKLSLFIKIWQLRIQNGETLTADALTLSALPAESQTFIAQLQAVTTPAPSAREAGYLLAFLLTQQFAPLPDAALATTFPAVKPLTANFMGLLTAQSALIDCSRLDLDRLTASLNQLHLQLVTFFVEPTTFIDPTQMQFFQELYPGFDVVINAALQHLEQVSTTPLTPKLRVNLYFSYMFALISAIPPRAVNDEVFICVDFSEGALYSDYVIQTLAAFSHAHIVVEDNVSTETDIYISDYHSDLVDAPQVIWQNPPTPTDWSDLADMILTTKHDKTLQLVK